MLKNYFKIAFRNLQKHKVFSIVNIVGLAVGLSVFWMMALYISDEMSYDRSFENAERIFRVVQSGSSATGSFKLAITAVPLAPALKHDYSEIADAARIDQEGGGIIDFQDKKIKADDILLSDSSLINMFRYPFLSGNPMKALAKPNSIVLTRGLALRLFGEVENALNKVISFENENNPVYRVTGVIEDIPANSHLHFSALRSLPSGYSDSWENAHVYTYIMLKPGVDPKKLEAKFPGFYASHFPVQLARLSQYRMDLQPVTSIHLHSAMDYEIGHNGDIRYIYLFSIVALLILVIALINYINLATARSSIRVKEVGIRKVIGSGRKHLILLFLSESVLFTLIAAVVAVFLSGIFLPLFNRLSGKTLGLWQFGRGTTLSVLVLFSLFTGLTGGIYPALFLSRFRPIPALKGQQGNLHSNVIFRKVLVSFQFVMTITLIAGCCIIYQQLHFLLNKDLGFNKDQVLTFHIHNPAVRNQVEALKAKLQQSPLIESAAAASIPIGNNYIESGSYYFEEQNGEIASSSRQAQNLMIDASYLNTLQIKLITGRNFSDSRPTDKTGAILINETLVKELGWTDPIGKQVQYKSDGQGHTSNFFVIGVVKDFSIYSLQYKIAPLLLQMPPTLNDEDNLYVRVSKNNISGAIAYIKEIYHQFDPDASFEYHFLDENFAVHYESEKTQGSLILVFTVLAIFIACLGLFGLVTFTAEQRTREIGVRKVLGASVTSIVRLLSGDLIVLVCLAIFVATPIAWYCMHVWLENFAYHVSVSAWVFLFSGTLAVLIALITVSFQAIRAAGVNPIKSLRSE
jgi:putative ABC transport system permease protein